MASLYKKVISGRPYLYLREMGWVDGKPKLVSERYVGTAAEIEALLDAREQAVMPERTRHLPGAGGAEPARCPVLQAGVRRLVEDHRGGPVHQDPRGGAGPPPVLGCDARCHAGAAGGDLPADRAAAGRGVRGGCLLSGPGHDQLRYVHRYR